MRSFVLVLAGAVLSSSLVLAQTAEPTAPAATDVAPEANAMVDVPLEAVTEELISGADAVADDGRTIGEVTAMSMDSENQPQDFAVDTSTFFGLIGDTKLVPVEMTSIQEDTSNGQLVLRIHLTSEEVESLPTFEG